MGNGIGSVTVDPVPECGLDEADEQRSREQSAEQRVIGDPVQVVDGLAEPRYEGPPRVERPTSRFMEEDIKFAQRGLADSLTSQFAIECIMMPRWLVLRARRCLTQSASVVLGYHHYSSSRVYPS